MFIRIKKLLDGRIEVWIMKDDNNGIMIQTFINKIAAGKPIRDLLAVMNVYRVEWIREIKAIVYSDLEEILN